MEKGADNKLGLRYLDRSFLSGTCSTWCCCLMLPRDLHHLVVHRDQGFQVLFSENSGGFSRVLLFSIKFVHFSAVDCRLDKNQVFWCVSC